jgi:hypothetical protein
VSSNLSWLEEYLTRMRQKADAERIAGVDVLHAGFDVVAFCAD